MAETRQVSGVPNRWCPDDTATGTEPGTPRGAGSTVEAGGTVLGAAELLGWGRACVAALDRARSEIDALNVFPVADSDTGTNLLATMRSAVAEAETVAETAGGVPASDGATHLVAVAMMRGATAGARGNSGLILSQVLRGIAEATVDTELTGAVFRNALALAAELVRSSLSEPVEGTVLTVLDRASAATADGPGAPDMALATVVRAAADGAARALDRTRNQLAVLHDAGVVDAGARGLLVLLDTLVEVVTGELAVRREYRPDARPGSATARWPEPACFEVMYRIDGVPAEAAAELRARLAGSGDSVVVAGAEGDGWSVHVHCADAGAAIEAGLAVGRVHGIRIEHLVGSVPDNRVADDHRCAGTDSGRPIEPPADRGVLAVAAGSGAAALFEAAGAVVLSAEPALHASALLAAIRRMPHREVLVLPNGALPAHELVAVGVAARDAHRDVLLLPSTSMVQGLAAVAVHDRERIAVDDAFAMSEAAAGTRWGALRRAPGRALTMVGTCAPGDGLGLVGHDVVVIDRDIRAAGRTLLDRMLGLGGELVTLLSGAAAPDGLAGELAEHIRVEFPGVEVTVYSGEQQGDLIQIGVE